MRTIKILFLISTGIFTLTTYAKADWQSDFDDQIAEQQEQLYEQQQAFDQQMQQMQQQRQLDAINQRLNDLEEGNQ